MENEYRLFCMNSIGYWILSIWLFTWILDIPGWLLNIENRLFTWILDIPCWLLDIENRLFTWLLDIPCWLLDIENRLFTWLLDISSSPAGSRKAARGIGY